MFGGFQGPRVLQGFEGRRVLQVEGAVSKLREMLCSAAVLHGHREMNNPLALCELAARALNISAGHKI